MTRLRETVALASLLSLVGCVGDELYADGFAVRGVLRGETSSMGCSYSSVGALVDAGQYAPALGNGYPMVISYTFEGDSLVVADEVEVSYRACVLGVDAEARLPPGYMGLCLE